MSDLPMVSSFQTILRAQHGLPCKTRMFCIFLYNMLTYVACFLAFMLEFVTVCAFSGGHKYGLGTGPSITSKASSWLSTCSGCEGAGHCSCEEPRLQRILAVVVVVSEPSGISLLQGGWASQMIGFTRDRENMRGLSTPHVCSLIHFKLVF